MTSVEYKGAIFDGRGDAILKRFEDDAQKDIAEDVNTRLHLLFGRYFKHRTGRYESTVKVRHSNGSLEVGDQGSVYGPWLEGTSSKNKQTRFRGYKIFRKAFEQEDSHAVSKAEVLFARKYERKFD